MDVIVDHNPGCATSRATPAIIGRAGVEPHIGLDQLSTQQYQAG